MNSSAFARVRFPNLLKEASAVVRRCFCGWDDGEEEGLVEHDADVLAGVR